MPPSTWSYLTFDFVSAERSGSAQPPCRHPAHVAPTYAVRDLLSPHVKQPLALKLQPRLRLDKVPRLEAARLPRRQVVRQVLHLEVCESP